MSTFEALIQRLKAVLGLPLNSQNQVPTVTKIEPLVEAPLPLEEPASEVSDTKIWEEAAPISNEVVDADDSAPIEVLNKRPKTVITVLSGKGGVGKTTTILGIAGDFLTQGKKVLFVDLDPQGSLSTAVLDQPEVESALDAFKGKTLQSLAIKSVWKEFANQVYVVPAYRSLLAVDGQSDPKQHESVLANFLGDLSEFDAVLVDAPASLSKLTAEAVAIASDVVIVAEPALYSLRAAADAFEFANEVKRVKRSWSRKVRVVLNKLDDSEEAQYRAREIKRLFPGAVCRTSISLNPAVNYANAAGLPVQGVEFPEAVAASEEFSLLVAELLA